MFTKITQNFAFVHMGKDNIEIDILNKKGILLKLCHLFCIFGTHDLWPGASTSFKN